MESRIEVDEFVQKHEEEYDEFIDPIAQLRDSINEALLGMQEEQENWNKLRQIKKQEIAKAEEEYEREKSEHRKTLSKANNSILSNSHITNMKAELRDAIDQFKTDMKKSLAKIGSALSEGERAYRDFQQRLQLGETEHF